MIPKVTLPIQHFHPATETELANRNVHLVHAVRALASTFLNAPNDYATRMEAQHTV